MKRGLALLTSFFNSPTAVFAQQPSRLCIYGHEIVCTKRKINLSLRTFYSAFSKISFLKFSDEFRHEVISFLGCVSGTITGVKFYETIFHFSCDIMIMITNISWDSILQTRVSSWKSFWSAITKIIGKLRISSKTNAHRSKFQYLVIRYETHKYTTIIYSNANGYVDNNIAQKKVIFEGWKIWWIVCKNFERATSTVHLLANDFPHLYLCNIQKFYLPPIGELPTIIHVSILLFIRYGTT